MGQGVLIIGESGSGKSTAGRNLDPKETVWVNVANKPLPFKGWKSKYSILNKENPKGNLVKASKAAEILKTMKHVSDNMLHIKTILVDDWQYQAAFLFFDRIDDKGYDKFTEIAKGISDLARAPITLRDDLTVVFLTHSEETQDQKGRRKTKAKTAGKLVDNSLTLEGLFSIVLYARIAMTEKGREYVLDTVSDGTNTCKSPMGMFETETIPNDFQIVLDAIKDFE